jgi:hypothetical protein
MEVNVEHEQKMEAAQMRFLRIQVSTLRDRRRRKDIRNLFEVNIITATLRNTRRRGEAMFTGFPSINLQKQFLLQTSTKAKHSKTTNGMV